MPATAGVPILSNSRPMTVARVDKQLAALSVLVRRLEQVEREASWLEIDRLLELRWVLMIDGEVK